MLVTARRKRVPSESSDHSRELLDLAVVVTSAPRQVNDVRFDVVYGQHNGGFTPIGSGRALKSPRGSRSPSMTPESVFELIWLFLSGAGRTQARKKVSSTSKTNGLVEMESWLSQGA